VRSISAGAPSMPEHPGQQLPIATRPAVVAPCGDVVSGWKLLDDFDVGDESRTSKDSLEQIVAEQG
jgi:hypothetical protein